MLSTSKVHEELLAEMERVVGDESDPELVARVRVFLRAYFGGQVNVEKGKDEETDEDVLFAVYRKHREMLFNSCIRNGSGGAT